MSSTMQKWPTIFNAVNVSSSVLGESLTLYFLTGVVNQIQADELRKVIPILSELEIEQDKWVLTTLVNKSQLNNLYEFFEPLSREWRGQYYALANAIVDMCKPLM
jgi:hypothetical protein